MHRLGVQLIDVASEHEPLLLAATARAFEGVKLVARDHHALVRHLADNPHLHAARNASHDPVAAEDAASTVHLCPSPCCKTGTTEHKTCSAIGLTGKIPGALQ
jgi:hypothetical protein